MNYRKIIILLLTTSLLSSLAAQSVTEKRTFIRSMTVNKDTYLEVSNKYGTIHITSWNKDSASIRAEIEAFAPNQAKLKKMFDEININFTVTNYLVRAQSDFKQSISMLFESFKGMTDKLIPYDSRVQINYYITIPEYLNLKIENRYGDVYMENITGNFEISLSNGSFKANSIARSSKINLTFCDATINSITTADINASFSEMNIGESVNLDITGISSRFEMRHADKLQIESRRDKFFIGTVGSIQGNSYFSDIKIEKLTKDINLTTKYGSVNTDLIENGIDFINLLSGYTDIGLTFDPDVSYNLDIRYINTFLSLPQKNSNLEKKAIDEDKREFITFGTIGKNPGNKKVKIDATRGNIVIR
jgi:hypothetical protein